MRGRSETTREVRLPGCEDFPTGTVAPQLAPAIGRLVRCELGTRRGPRGANEGVHRVDPSRGGRGPEVGTATGATVRRQAGERAAREDPTEPVLHATGPPVPERSGEGEPVADRPTSDPLRSLGSEVDPEDPGHRRSTRTVRAPSVILLRRTGGPAGRLGSPGSPGRLRAPPMEVHANPTPAEGHPFDREAQSLFPAVLSSEGDLPSRRDHPMPGQPGPSPQGPYGQARPSGEPGELRDLPVGRHPALWYPRDHLSETSEGRLTSHRRARAGPGTVPSIPLHRSKSRTGHPLEVHELSGPREQAPCPCEDGSRTSPNRGIRSPGHSTRCGTHSEGPERRIRISS